MSENTAQAACTQREWEMARDAGLPFFTTADEAAIHKFATAIRAERDQLVAELLDELRRTRNYLSTEIAYTHSPDGEDFATHADYEASLVVHSIDNLIAKATGSAA